ncbi:Acyl-CoA dehydrogenase [Pseudosulfitobacter pseudonitzschiae]|jgi:alkylation response protein AidB-like acyl-CoA dehydrogenase|uniref:Acyl-CoA dehydrogenase n=2 Tax=Pseudosulfitobacter pseudonitzschiae TaxID=1402135 RepID=A0A073IXC1_9RHOB|nr:acyl-CoA dehydrogenase [Pseudosulfitobacter pseudonitzschiae]MCA0137471.1 acyl-CoA dehydrogenase family protein [Pseudosulfitobacter pseudonitzschiae]UFE45225.1 acyl-CoA dehydrogenase family protein [Pseudosulfitobacter pseudonitzschiae]UFE54151.1 acyl-CoA dehydrogenase family protein [Pseudosulfitobacter pseudonitzschiae]UFE68715.1 acyl-CoA dehydrogenase family protein [Pseudosulfitobacter pseudonitzschiae]
MTQTDMQPSDQQDLRMLRESARTLFERAGGSGRSRKLRDAGGGWDADMIREMAEAGIFGVTLPEENGGLGMGLAAGGVIAEEVGRVIAPEPVVVTVGLSLGLLRRLCPDHAMMEQLVEGATVLAVAWQERGPNGGPAEPSCRYADGKLTGGKAWVAGAGGAGGFLVVAEGDAGPVLVLAEAGADGLSVEERRQADGSAMGELSFSGTPAGELASGGAVRAALAEAVNDATALAAAELVGLSERAFEITLDYIKTREQFDKPIGSFQVIQHRAVDLNVMCEVAQSGVREALGLMDRQTDPKARARLASRAKARAVTAAKKITRDAIQLHGAVGYTDEFEIALYLNRALVLSAWLGDDAYHRRLWFEAREEEGAAQ